VEEDSSPFLDEDFEVDEDDSTDSLDFDEDDRLDDDDDDTSTGNFEVVIGALAFRGSTGVRCRVGICEKSIGLTILSKPPARRRVKVVTGASTSFLISGSLGDVGVETGAFFFASTSLVDFLTTGSDALISSLVGDDLGAETCSVNSSST
jgi:hypothetical protein